MGHSFAGAFILASSYWYREYNKMKLYIPISLLAGTLIGFYIGSRDDAKVIVKCRLAFYKGMIGITK